MLPRQEATAFKVLLKFNNQMFSICKHTHTHTHICCLTVVLLEHLRKLITGYEQRKLVIIDVTEGDYSCNFQIWKKNFKARESDYMQLDIHAIIQKCRGSALDSIQLSSSASSFFSSHPSILPLSYFPFLHLLLLPFFPALLSPPAP